MKKSLVLVIVLAALLLVATPTLAQGQPKRDVCHWDGSQFIRITIADPAWDAHLAHGDKEVGVDVDESCQPLWSGPQAGCFAYRPEGPPVWVQTSGDLIQSVGNTHPYVDASCSNPYAGVFIAPWYLIWAGSYADADATCTGYLYISLTPDLYGCSGVN